MKESLSLEFASNCESANILVTFVFFLTIIDFPSGGRGNVLERGKFSPSTEESESSSRSFSFANLFGGTVIFGS